MAPRHRLAPAHEPGRVGARVHQIQSLPGVRPAQLEHDASRVQADLLDGVDTPPVGQSDWRHLPPPDRLLHRPAQSDPLNGMETYWHMRHDRIPGLHRLVDGCKRLEGRPLRAREPSSRQPIPLDCPSRGCVCRLLLHATHGPWYPQGAPHAC